MERITAIRRSQLRLVACGRVYMNNRRRMAKLRGRISSSGSSLCGIWVIVALGFALMACLALHDKTAPDETFAAFLPLIEKGARDERNFVKKGVNWALRAIGRRNLALNAAAVVVAKHLASSDEAACRWVGKDALRELKSPKVRTQLARRAQRSRVAGR